MLSEEQKINFDEIDVESGFKRVEQYVWKAYEKTFLRLNYAEEIDCVNDESADVNEEAEMDDVDSWINSFLEENEQSGLRLDVNFVKAICTLGIYAGPRDEFQQRCGNGKAIYNNGDRYEGDFFADQKHGNGKYLFVSQGMSEVDKLVRDVVMKKFHGQRSQVDQNAIEWIAKKLQLSTHVVRCIIEYGYYPCYHGEYVHNMRTGCGIMKNKDASLYKGEFCENKRHGHGMFYYLNGDIFSGNWENNFKHGFGTYRFADGSEYRGEWQRGVFIEGQWIMSDGTYYEGKFDLKNRPLDSLATMHFPHLGMSQRGSYTNGRWNPATQLVRSNDTPVKGMIWVEESREWGKQQNEEQQKCL